MAVDVKSKKGITYEVPVTVLFPKREEVTNFIVPVCMSASHVAFTSLRIEPMVFTIYFIFILYLLLCLVFIFGRQCWNCCCISSDRK